MNYLKNLLSSFLSKLSIFRELWSFFLVRKKWWLLPIMVFLILFGFLMLFAQSSVLGPFIYTIF
ncbi:MAG: hypothetical protein CMI54_01335 [Parcubacteria group bacterium]|nr:hypothetical protein [Parcubacteria group bacterium]